jgi:hypothetical protein
MEPELLQKVIDHLLKAVDGAPSPLSARVVVGDGASHRIHESLEGRSAHELAHPARETTLNRVHFRVQPGGGRSPSPLATTGQIWRGRRDLNPRPLA